MVIGDALSSNLEAEKPFLDRGFLLDIWDDTAWEVLRNCYGALQFLPGAGLSQSALQSSDTCFLAHIDSSSYIDPVLDVRGFN